jgi:A/G-specific adenine glycosylase
VDRHDGVVPAEYDELRALPGVGAYTAAAVASFAYRRRHAVLDTNVRRVLARVMTGVQYPPKAQTTAEVRLAEKLLPPDPPVAARWSVAVMELGALVCTARTPRCADCPLSGDCTWRLAGKPAYDGPPRKGQTYAGTDRQCRGRLLAVLRHSTGPVEKAALDDVWDDTLQRERSLAALIEDGLVDPLEDGRYALPS